MNRKVLFIQVAAIHLMILGLLFSLMNCCERKKTGDYGPPPVPVSPSVEEPREVVKRAEPKEIIEEEEPLVIKEYGRPGVVKASEIKEVLKEEREERVHKVKKGETLSGIAQDSGVTMKAIMKLNNIKDPAKIMVGQKIKIPGE